MHWKSMFYRTTPKSWMWHVSSQGFGGFSYHCWSAHCEVCRRPLPSLPVVDFVSQDNGASHSLSFHSFARRYRKHSAAPLSQSMGRVASEALLCRWETWERRHVIGGSSSTRRATEADDSDIRLQEEKMAKDNGKLMNLVKGAEACRGRLRYRGTTGGR